VLGGFLLGVLSTALLLVWLLGPSTFDGLPTLLVERLRGERPQTQVDAYVRAILAGDEEAALDVWVPPDSERSDEQSEALRQRRQEITQQWIAANLGETYTITDIDWWTTCCTPHVTCDARSAGGARIRVQFLDQDGLPVLYIFDVFHEEVPYGGATTGYPPRRWALYDVYPLDGEPLFWRYTYNCEGEWLKWPTDDTPIIEW
jgi:hypothetical protein